MAHFICTGDCHGVSDKPGVCEADVCAKKGKPLIECDCEDGKHEEVLRRGGKSYEPMDDDPEADIE